MASPPSSCSSSSCSSFQLPTLSDHPSNWPLPKHLWKVCRARNGVPGQWMGSNQQGLGPSIKSLLCPSVSPPPSLINLSWQFDVNLISYSCRFTTNLSLCWALSGANSLPKLGRAEKVSSITHYEDIHASAPSSSRILGLGKFPTRQLNYVCNWRVF